MLLARGKVRGIAPVGVRCKGVEWHIFEVYDLGLALKTLGRKHIIKFRGGGTPIIVEFKPIIVDLREEPFIDFVLKHKGLEKYFTI